MALDFKTLSASRICRRFQRFQFDENNRDSKAAEARRKQRKSV